jgi:hypothetical protein
VIAYVLPSEQRAVAAVAAPGRSGTSIRPSPRCWPDQCESERARARAAPEAAGDTVDSKAAISAGGATRSRSCLIGRAVM